MTDIEVIDKYGVKVVLCFRCKGSGAIGPGLTCALCNGPGYLDINRVRWARWDYWPNKTIAEQEAASIQIGWLAEAEEALYQAIEEPEKKVLTKYPPPPVEVTESAMYMYFDGLNPQLRTIVKKCGALGVSFIINSGGIFEVRT